MASPASSPPSTSLALPRQRPTINTSGLALPTNPPNPRRKPSTASTASSSHPLRQTSFPPPEGQSALYSPEGSADFSDSEINGAIAGSDLGTSDMGVGKKRKRGEKKMRGRPPKNPQAAAAARAGSTVNGGDKGAEGGAEGEEDEDEEDAVDARDDIAARLMEESLHQNELLLQMDEEQLERHAVYKRSKLRVSDMRRLINQTVSQSVPANVVTVVGAYTKMFAGILIEGAREVQSEWMAVEEKRADGEINPAAKRLRMMPGEEDVEVNGKTQDTATEASSSTAKANGHSGSDDTQPNTDDGSATLPPNDEPGVRSISPSRNIRRHLSDHDRGPLTPDHLREALRRYKKSQYGGAVGFTGLSLEGKDVAAARVGGRRLFR